MLIAPWLVGLIIVGAHGRFAAADVVLFALWIAGYFAFYATSLWLKSRRRPRYLPSTRAYTGLVLALGLVTVILQPTIWSWLLVYVPVLVAGLWFAYRRDDRSLASGAATVTAACLMPAVVYADGLFDFVDGIGAAAYDAIGLVCLACFGYFFGTVLYVKTLIRERGHVGYVVASVAWHVVCAGAAVPLAVVGSPLASWAGWTLVALFTALAARALLLPLCWPMRGKTLAPGRIGIGELFATLALVAVLTAAA